MPDTTTHAGPVLPYDDEAERVLAALAGETGNDCIYCGRVLAGEHDGWAHKRCKEVVEADNEARQIRDNGPLEQVERKLRRHGRCPHQDRPRGRDGDAIYCGQPISADPGEFCPQHQREAEGDDEGAARERSERTLNLLAIRDREG